MVGILCGGERVHVRSCERDRRAENHYGPVHRYLTEPQLDLPWSLGIAGLSHCGSCVPEVDIGRVEVGVVERVEQLCGELQAELLRDVEPLLNPQIFVDETGSPEVREVTRGTAKRVSGLKKQYLVPTEMGLLVPAPH